MIDYIATITLSPDLRKYYHDKWEKLDRKTRPNWKDYLGDIIVMALEVIRDNEL